MSTEIKRPLEGVVVLEFSQFLAGPVAGLRLSDLGARVIKIEKPEVGDLCRYIYLSDTNLSGDNSLFHAINRNKESFVADLKNSSDLKRIKKLISKADIITQNFRPGVIERIGLDYENVKNPKSYDEFTVPVCAFITFESDDHYNEACSFAKKKINMFE